MFYQGINTLPKARIASSEKTAWIQVLLKHTLIFLSTSK
jgi:hypothetical protein